MITKLMKRSLRKQCKTHGNGDWLVGRLRLLNKLNACAEGGKIGVFTWGSDCDGQKFERSFTVNASVMSVINFERDYYYGTDDAGRRAGLQRHPLGQRAGCGRRYCRFGAAH